MRRKDSSTNDGHYIAPEIRQSPHKSADGSVMYGTRLSEGSFLAGGFDGIPTSRKKYKESVKLILDFYLLMEDREEA